VTKQTLQYAPDYAVAPGEILQEALVERQMTQAELARRTDRPLKTINEIINGKAAITPETAIQLERVLGIPDRVWNNLEVRYRAALARAEEHRQLAGEVAWLNQIPVAEMIKHGLIPRLDDRAATLAEVLKFFGVSTTSAWERQWASGETAFRQALKFTISPGAVAVWLRWGELKAGEIEGAPYDPSRFRAALERIKPLTREDPAVFVPAVQRLCAEAGVAVVFIPELPQTRVSGATKWLSAEKALIQLSLRYKTNDQLWFTFFHEAGHILLHLKRELVLEGIEEVADPAKEEEANKFATEFLIPRREFEEFVQGAYDNSPAISRFASRIGIAPGIVVGRLQHDGLLPYRSTANQLKRSLRWSNG
jgi:addiction module HigA family antidote